MSDPDGWTMTVRVRVVNSEDYSYRGYGVAFGVYSQTNYFLLGLVGAEEDPQADDGIWLYTGGGFIPYYLMDTASSYHTYQLAYRPQDEVCSVFVDGARVGDVPALASSGGQLIGFGAASGGATSDSNWNYVAFETGQHVVPEPSTLALLGLGALALLAWKYRRP
jgi:hypothetical protein